MKNSKRKPGAKDRDYVNKSEKYEVEHEPKRSNPAKNFGEKRK